MAVILHLVDALAALLLVIIARSFRASQLFARRRRGHPLPPGPRPLPLLGNFLDVPKKHGWATFREWGKQYSSDIVYVEMMGQTIVVLNTPKAINDLFDKRSSIYSDRPTFYALKHILNLSWVTGTSQYGPIWRKHRKGLALSLNPTAMLQYQPVEAKATHRLLRHLLDTPNDYTQHIRHMAGQISLSISYGLDVKPRDDPYVEMAERGLHALFLGSQLRGQVFDMIPFLRYMPWWFPGAGLKKEGREYAAGAAAMLDVPFAVTESLVVQGSAPPSVAATMIAEQNSLPLSDRDVFTSKAVPANIYFGGADSLVAILSIFLLAMVLNPEAQKKAQEELDAVLLGSRLPEFEDEASLPYVGALVKEVFRWHPGAPLGVPRRLTRDDVYEGYFIPEGSVVMANIWAILHDETAFPDPYKFEPERYLGSNAAATFPDAVFGFGRRACPGRYMAHASLWIAIASILATFEICPAVDEQGRELEATEDFASGIIGYPTALRCILRPRSSAAESLVLATKSEDAFDGGGGDT
ncbi:cytochrome P450 [Amylostereum chailletii]|nr:cytochrome P450 [Amylostereum chailletii]